MAANYKIKRIIRQCQERHPEIDKDVVRAIWLDGYSVATLTKDSNNQNNQLNVLRIIEL